MKLVQVKDKEMLDFLEKQSALTLEGLLESEAIHFVKWVKKLSSLSEENVYIIKGKLMNEVYGLTGDNAYPDDLTIQAIPLNQINNVSALIVKRFEIGARWFDDIVENNRRRENMKN